MDRATACILGALLESTREAASREDGLRRLASALSAEMRCERVAVLVRASRRDGYVVGTTAGEGPVLASDDLEPEDGERLDALAQQGPAVLRHEGEAAPLAARLGLAGLHALVVPLRHRGRNEGLVACGRRAAPFSAAERDAWTDLAPNVALLLRAWRLDDVQARARSQRRHFGALTAGLLEASDLGAAGARLCELTRAIMETTRSALFLLEDRDLVPIAAAGPYGDRAAGGTLHVPPGVEPAFDEVLATQRVLVINDFRASPYAATPIPLPFRPQAATVIPLVDGSGTLGVLTASELGDPHRFGPEAADEARMLGTLATITIRRVLLVEELRRAGRAKDEFLAAVSHELRTPLNVVLGYVQLLAENAFGPLTSEQAETVRRVEHGARAQLSLVNDLLDLAEIERGALHCEPGPVPIASLVEELCDLAPGLLAGRPIAFTTEVAPDVVAHTDRERLKQILINLLGNAAKFTERGTIAVRASRAGDAIEVIVSDTGSGMEPGFLGRATEPFVRGDGPNSGSGLGLAIVSRLLRALDGRLAIDSKPGEGTTVRVLLPASAAAGTVGVAPVAASLDARASARD